MSEQTCIIIGASHAGTSLALQLRREGWEGAIKLIGAESELPYHRPPLSKDYLAGDKELDAMRLRPAKAFEDNNVELLLGNSVLGFDPEAHTVQLSGGQSLAYDKLALCVGASVRKLSLGSDLENVFYLRTCADAALLREQLQPGRKAVVVGAGYIGLEAAAVMRQLDMDVTVIEFADRILSRVTSAAVSDYMQAVHESHGVKFRLNSRVLSLRGERSVEAVNCSQGDPIPADVVVLGVGIVPNTKLAETAGLIVDDGIQVDQYAQTSAADVFAAGDCTIHPSQLYRRPLRLESVQNANDQSRIAAANICGKETSYDAVPWFWSDQYDLKMQTAGLHNGHDQLVFRGDPKSAGSEGFAVFYLLEGKLLAVDCINRPKEFMATKQLLAKQLTPDLTVLADESVAPADWLNP